MLFSKPNLIPNLDRMLGPWSSDSQRKFSQLRSPASGFGISQVMENGGSLSTLTRARWKEWMTDGPSGTLKEFPKTRSWYGWLAHPTSAEWKANDLFWDPGLTSLINSFIQSLIQPISRQTCTHTWERQISVPMNTFQVEEMKTLIGVMASGMETERVKKSFFDRLFLPPCEIFTITSQETLLIPFITSI